MDTPTSSPLRVRLLGGFELGSADGGDVTPPRRKLRALVALLALAPAAGWSRDQLTAVLWGDRDEEQARASLRQALAELRRMLGETVLRTDREIAAFNPEAVQADAVEFVRLAAEGSLEEAAALYHGELLDGIGLPDAGFADWLVVERTRLHDLAIDVLAQLLDRQSGEVAIATAQRLLRLEPAHEETHRALMRLYAAQGDRSQALRQFHICRGSLQRELGIEPEPETERLCREIQSSIKAAALAQDPLPEHREPSVAVSSAVHDPSQGRLERAREIDGEQLADIGPGQAHPAGTGEAVSGAAFKPTSFRVRLAAAAVVALALTGAGAWWISSSGVKPVSIAVLPFDNLGGDPEQGYFADGMTEDLITDLSKVAGIFVISRNSSWAYKGKPTKVQTVAEELGVRYLLQGSVRREGDTVRVNAQLVDAVGGQHLWADRYDGSMDAVFALQDKVIRQIVAALAVNLTHAEQAQLDRPETQSMEAYDALLRGWEHYRRDTEEETNKAISSFEKAIALDPDYSRAHAALAAASWRIAKSYWESASSGGFMHAMDRMNESLAEAAKQPNSLAFAISAEVLSRQGRYDEAFAEIGRATALSPNDAEIFLSKARILNATGRAPEAEEAVRWAMRLDPRYSPEYLRVLAISLFHQERYEEAVEALESLLNLQSDNADDYTTLVTSLGHLGRTEGVSAAIKAFNSLTVAAGYSPMTVQEQGGWWWYGDIFDYDPTYRDRLREGLRKAGVPEGAGTDIPPADYLRLMSKTQGEFNVAGATKIDVKTAKALRERGVIFVDVRAPEDFARGHVPGASNICVMTDLTEHSLSRVAGKNDEIVFSCHGKYCGDSAYASAKAVIWGYSRVYYFAGGFPAWKDAGYPVEKASGM